MSVKNQFVKHNHHSWTRELKYNSNGELAEEFNINALCFSCINRNTEQRRSLPC